MHAFFVCVNKLQVDQEVQVQYYPVHMSNFLGFNPAVISSSFCIMINFLRHNHFFYLRHQRIDYDAKTSSNNRGFKAHENYTGG